MHLNIDLWACIHICAPTFLIFLFFFGGGGGAGGGAGGDWYVCAPPPTFNPRFLFNPWIICLYNADNNYLAFFIYQLLWTISINLHRWLLVKKTIYPNTTPLYWYRRYVNYVSVCPPPPAISRSSQCSATGVTKAMVISRSSQCSTTGVTKAVVCVILSVGWCI